MAMTTRTSMRVNAVRWTRWRFRRGCIRAFLVREKCEGYSTPLPIGNFVWFGRCCQEGFLISLHAARIWR